MSNTEMGEGPADGTLREGTVKTPLDDIAQDAALAAGLIPGTAEVVDADVTIDNELALKLRGEALD